MISFPIVRILRENITNDNNIMRITTFVIAATIFIISLQALYFSKKICTKCSKV